MVTLNITDNYFEYVRNHPECKNVVYGVGHVTRSNYRSLGHIDLLCDKNAGKIESIENLPCLTPKELSEYKDKVTILICIQNKSVVSEVCYMLDELEIDGEVFSFFDNPAFPWFDHTKYRYAAVPKEKLKIRIVYANDGWIFGKFADKLQSELTKMGQDVEIAETEDPNADVNHYISYSALQRFTTDTHTVRTTMITHIDCLMKRDMIEFQAQNGAVGVCMSADTMNKLAAWGIPRDRLCYVNPAQDGEIKPKKIVLGITNRCHGDLDYRKRDDLILMACRQLDPQSFMLKFMGAGWDKIVEEIRQLGFEVEYYGDFDRQVYMELMPSLDYWIYYGFDEGAMGFLDALAAGVKTIATPQGYHLDAKGGLTYPCSTIDDFVNVLKKIQDEKKAIVDSVKDWTWENYARKHLEIWQYLGGTKPLGEIYKHQSEYMDGIFSLLISDISL